MLLSCLGRPPQTPSIVKDTSDARDYKFEENFSLNKSEPKHFQHEIKPFIDCGYILACVASAFTTVNSWYLGKELSWRFLYANVEHIKGGVRIRDTASFLKHSGQPEDELMPQSEYHRAENQWQELEEINEPMRLLALKNKCGSYYYLSKRTSLKQAVMLAPTIVWLKTDRYWHDPRQQIIRYRWWLPHLTHAVVIYGWDKDWLIIDCRGKKKRELASNYPLLGACFITKNVLQNNNNAKT